MIRHTTSSFVHLLGICILFGVSVSDGFLPMAVQQSHFALKSTANADLGSTTIQTENYDIVKVDLDEGRDYPIYIGTGYSEQEGVFLMLQTFGELS